MSFFGALVITVIAAILQRRLGSRPATRWIITAAVFYAASLVVTVGANIPLNEGLRHAGNPDQIRDIAIVRQQFEVPWGVWNAVRGVLATAALGCLALALVLHGGANQQFANKEPRESAH